MKPITGRFPFSPLLLLWVLVCPLFTSAFASEKEILLTEDVQLRIADAFMDDAEYYRAITEYKRFLIVFPDSERVDYVWFRIGMANYLGEEYESSVRSFDALRRRCPGSSYSAQARYFEGLSYWKLKRYHDAKTAFQMLAEDHPDSEYAPLAIIGDAMLALDEENAGASRQGLQRLITSYPGYLGTTEAKEAMKLLDQYQALPRKSEVLAGMMSAVLPGSGYFYAERYGDGITAFLINGLAIAGTVTAIYQENYAVAAVVGGIGLPFYFGNIYGSANAAKKWNIAVRRELRNRMCVTLNYDF
jgi:outer membrane protein assembly factor BamD (BamD/ComL family)/TM2 domain-containing membrane protein YozV